MGRMTEPEIPELTRLRYATQLIANGWDETKEQNQAGAWVPTLYKLDRYDMQKIANKALQGKRNTISDNKTELGRLQHVLTRIVNGYYVERTGNHKEIYALSRDDMQIIAHTRIALEG